jgi:DNA end-binding protein Ku
VSSITNTTLCVGLLVVPVGLKKMSESTDVRLDRASKDGNPIGRTEVDKVTGEVVMPGDAQYGKYEDAKAGTGFRPISKDDIAAIEAETSIDTFDIEKFIPLADVPFERVQEAYYIVPQVGVSAKPLRLLHDALAKTKTAGVFKLVLRTRQHLAVIYAKNGALYINTLTFASDFRRASEAREVIAATEKPTAAMAAVAVDLIEAYTATGDVIDTFADDLIPLKHKLVAQALAGKKLTKKTASGKKQATGDAFEEALRESVKQAQARKKEKVKA